jgi:putative methyltransferase (TIGR04325 family)
MSFDALKSRRLRPWLPPALVQWGRARLGRSHRFGPSHASWLEACAAASGYDATVILRRVSDASRKVRDGLAAYERDSVLMDQIEYAFPVVATLATAAVGRGGALAVLDYGGALGSSYRECKAFLGSAVSPLRWFIVEQEGFVRVGRSEFETDELRFAESVGAAAAAASTQRFDVALFSSVLQYLPDPAQALREVLELAPSYVVIDRTIMSDCRVNVARVQSVPKHIYGASYPVWILSRSQLISQLSASYELVSEHASLPFPELEAIGASLRGLIFRRTTSR